MNKVTSCPNCGSGKLYRGPETTSGGGYAPNYLPGLGGFMKSAKFVIIVCEACGLTRYFASGEAKSKLSASSKWKKMKATDS